MVHITLLAVCQRCGQPGYLRPHKWQFSTSILSDTVLGWQSVDQCYEEPPNRTSRFLELWNCVSWQYQNLHIYFPVCALKIEQWILSARHKCLSYRQFNIWIVFLVAMVLFTYISRARKLLSDDSVYKTQPKSIKNIATLRIAEAVEPGWWDFSLTAVTPKRLRL